MSTRTPAVARSRVVLLGASNLTMGFRTAFALCHRLMPGPLDVLTAMGHGRSYGMTSRVLARELPGITECGLWPTLAARPPVPTIALATDVGNDLLYGARVADILGWVEWCLDRLQEASARISLTLPPMQSVRTLSAWRFHLFRCILFPTRRADFAGVLARAGELDVGLRQIASRRGIAVVEPPAEWYGFDPVHVLRRQRRAAWAAMLSPLLDCAAVVAGGQVSPRGALRLGGLAPERRRIFGIEQRRRQPTAVLEDGSWVSWF